MCAQAPAGIKKLRMATLARLAIIDSAMRINRSMAAGRIIK